MDNDANRDLPSIGKVITELQGSGFDVEAGALLLRKKGVHPALLNLNSSLGFLKFWKK